MNTPASFKRRACLQRIEQLYPPKQSTSHGAVILLDVHIEDLFFSSPTRPAVPLHQLLLDTYRSSVDAFVVYGSRDAHGNPEVDEEARQRLNYEFNRFPSASPAAVPVSNRPASGSSANSLLDDLDADIQQDRSQFQVQSQGRTTRNCSPADALREMHRLLNAPPGRRALIIFEDVFWAISDDDVLTRLRAWPSLCQTRNHLVVFALSQTNLSWIQVAFGEGRSKGVERLTVDGPTADEVKAVLLQRYLVTRRGLFEWTILDEIANALAEVLAPPEKGLQELARRILPEAEKDSGIFNRAWLEKVPRAGDKAEKVYLDDLILKAEEREFLEKQILPALRDPHWRENHARRLGLPLEDIEIPNRLLLIGPPGTGKTTIAKLIATESGLPFYDTKAGDFMSKYRGGPVEKVEEAFKEWRQRAPCVVFWDEVESVAPKRTNMQHEDNAITQILAELEPTAGKDTDLFILCATNCPELLDPAFKQRFRQILIGYPDESGMERLIIKYFPKHLLAPDITLQEMKQLFSNRAPREIRRCAKECINELTQNHKYSTITRRMIMKRLRDNPVDLETVRRWQQEEKNRG
jgi:adenylate kinase family enzyme